MTTFRMWRLGWFAVPRTFETIGWRSQHVHMSKTRSVSQFTTDVPPLRASRLGYGERSLNPHRGISCSTSLKSGKVDVKDIPKIRRNKWISRTFKPRITAADIIDSVFERTGDVLPSIPSLQEGRVKDASSYLSGIRRRAFLSDSATYRSSSLEMLKEQEQSYSSVDDERLEGLIKDATSTSRTISSCSPSEIKAALGSLSRAPMSRMSSTHSVFLQEMCALACQNIRMCTEEEFCSVLLALFRARASLTPEHREDLEKECERRLDTWDVNTMLLVSDWWICIQRKSPFSRLILTTLSTKLEAMTPQNIVQAFYVIGECQYVPSEEFLQKLTDLAERCLDSLTWNEVGVICNAYIKSRSRILSRTLQQSVSSRICQDLHTDSLDHYNLVTAMRFISRAYFHDWRLFEEIAHSLTPHVADMPFLVPPHIATAFAKVRHFNKPLMDAIARRAMQTADDVRFKDIWMLLWAFCRLNYDPPNSKGFFASLMHQLVDKAEQLEQPHQFMKSLVSLTFIEQYPSSLINKAFSPQSLQEYEDKCPPDIYKHLYSLDCSLAVERPEYQGNRLPQAFKDKFWLSPHGSKKVTYEKIPGLQEALQGLQCILGGAEYLKTHPILPHIRTPLDIEVHLDGSSKPLPLSSKPSCSLEEMVGARNAQDDTQRLAVLVAPRAHYRLYTTDLLGVHVMKRRQLTKVGYRIVEVPYNEWEPLLKKSESHRHDYLKAKIFIRSH